MREVREEAPWMSEEGNPRQRRQPVRRLGAGWRNCEGLCDCRILERVSGDEWRDGGVGQGSREATPGLGLFSEEHGGPGGTLRRGCHVLTVFYQGRPDCCLENVLDQGKSGGQRLVRGQLAEVQLSNLTRPISFTLRLQHTLAPV